MKSSLRVVAGLTLVLALLLALSAMTVSAQGPTATPAATSVPGTSPTPAAAPPAAAAGRNLDDPGIAATIGNAVAAVPANTAQWFRFDYVTPINTLPTNPVTIRMVNGVNSGLGFEVWSPERMQGNWWDNKPVGRGTQEVLPGCTVTNTDGTTSKCTTNDLTWVGGFGVSGPYYVRIVNDTGNPLTPQMIFGGSGLAQCATAPQGQAQPAAQSGQGFTQVQCTPEAAATAATGGAAAPAAGQTPAAAPTVAASPTTAATSTPEATSAPLATSTPAAAATAAATSAAGAATAVATSAAGAATSVATSAAGAATTTAGTSTPAGAPSVTPAAGGTTLTGLAVAQDAKLGPIVTDNQGRTLYAWTQDTSSTGTCTGSCAQTWPPALTSGTPQGGTGITASMIGTSARSDGGTQVTYNGHPLYWFSGDKNPGDTNGQGVAGKWFTVTPDGKLNQAGGAGGATTPGAAGTSMPSGAATSMPGGTATP
jgi:predicted lipoprotein with Yx(FWY)xxD motif